MVSEWAWELMKAHSFLSSPFYFCIYCFLAGSGRFCLTGIFGSPPRGSACVCLLLCLRQVISPQKRQVEKGSQSTPTTFSPCRSYAHFLQVPSSEHVPKIKIESNKKWKGPAIGSHSFFSSCRLTLMLGVRTHHSSSLLAPVKQYRG